MPRQVRDTDDNTLYYCVWLGSTQDAKIRAMSQVLTRIMNEDINEDLFDRHDLGYHSECEFSKWDGSMWFNITCICPHNLVDVERWIDDYFLQLHRRSLSMQEEVFHQHAIAAAHDFTATSRTFQHRVRTLHYSMTQAGSSEPFFDCK